MKRGFTLIEILVVVAIIAMLVAILIPSLSRARDQARSAKCLANMRDMSTGVNTFAATHKGRFQLVTGGGANPNPHNAQGPNADPQRSTYLYESDVSHNPALLVWPAVLLREAQVRIKNNDDWGILGQANAAANQTSIPYYEIMSCPADEVKFNTPLWPLEYYGYLSYGINEDVTGDQTDPGNAADAVTPVWKDGAPNTGPRLLSKLDRIVLPAQVALFTDAGSDRPLGQQVGAANLLITRNARGPLLEYFEETWGGRLPSDRHRRGSLNVTYADGHGGFVRRSNGQDPEPDSIFRPKARVSPYRPGTYPIP